MVLALLVDCSVGSDGYGAIEGCWPRCWYRNHGCQNTNVLFSLPGDVTACTIPPSLLLLRIHSAQPPARTWTVTFLVLWVVGVRLGVVG